MKTRMGKEKGGGERSELNGTAKGERKGRKGRTHVLPVLFHRRDEIGIEFPVGVLGNSSTTIESLLS